MTLTLLGTIAAVIAAMVILVILIDAYNKRKLERAILRTKMQHHEDVKAGALRRLEAQQTWQSRRS